MTYLASAGEMAVPSTGLRTRTLLRVATALGQPLHITIGSAA